MIRDSLKVLGRKLVWIQQLNYFLDLWVLNHSTSNNKFADNIKQ